MKFFEKEGHISLQGLIWATSFRDGLDIPNFIWQLNRGFLKTFPLRSKRSKRYNFQLITCCRELSLKEISVFERDNIRLTRVQVVDG